MRCKCGGTARIHKIKTPDGIAKEYARMECGCGRHTSWCQTASAKLNMWLHNEWIIIQRKRVNPCI
jgi:hypothetical protein